MPDQGNGIELPSIAPTYEDGSVVTVKYSDGGSATFVIVPDQEWKARDLLATLEIDPGISQTTELAPIVVALRTRYPRPGNSFDLVTNGTETVTVIEVAPPVFKEEKEPA